MRSEIMRIHREAGTTTLYVTHDRREALSMSDRIVVLRDGVIEQSGTPRELYDRPANRFVAEFLGFANLVRATVTQVADGSLAVLANELGEGTELRIAAREDDRSPAPGDEIDVVIRPEMARAGEGANGNAIRGRIASSEFFGNRSELLVRCGASELKLEADHDVRPDEAGEVAFHLPADALTWVPA
jgi:ABC-type Fe3+/spermidine/putrescine transport system ATPase subunit